MQHFANSRRWAQSRDPCVLSCELLFVVTVVFLNLLYLVLHPR